MPLHNKAPHLERALGSVMKQGFPSFELIVVNDASTDGGEKILEQFNNDRTRIFQRTEPGPGGYAARNLGIEKALGKWVAFLDADDEWLPGHLFRLWELSEKFPSAKILGCGWHISDGSSSKISPYASRCGNPTVFDAASYVDVQSRGMDVLHTSVVAVERHLMTSIGGFPDASKHCKKAGDGQTWLRCMLDGAELGWRPEPGAIYYQNAVNMVTRAKNYDLDESCLINFLNKITRDEKKLPEALMQGLKRYRDSRVLSHLFQYARIGEVKREHVVRSTQHFRFDMRFFLILMSWLFPRIGKGVFKLKDKLAGTQCP